MIYIYDKVLEKYETSFKRYGVNYVLEKRFRMGRQLYYSFTAPGREKLLVIPGFAEQYREVERIRKSRRLDTCLGHIKGDINRKIRVDEYEDSNAADGRLTVISTTYKDIEISFEYKDNQLLLSPEFRIVENNLLGNGIVVIMNMDMEGETS